MNGSRPEPAPTPPLGGGGWAALVLAFAVGFAGFPLRVVGLGFDHLPGDLVDNRLNNFVLEHGYRWLTRADRHFWDAGAFYPARRTVAYSDAHVGTLPVYAGLRAAGLPPERAFQWLWLLTFPANYAAAAWAGRRAGTGAAGAAACGFVFAFGLPAVAEVGHAQMARLFLVPVAAAAGWRFLRDPTTGRLAAFGLAVVGQIYLGVYTAYFLVLYLLAGAVAAVLAGAVPWREHVDIGWGGFARRVGVAVAVGATLLPLAVPYGLAKRDYPPTPAGAFREYVPTPAAWLTPSPLSVHARWLAGPASEPAVDETRRLFPGVVPVIAVALGLAGVVRCRPRPDPVRVGAGAAVLLGAFVLRVGGFSLYDQIDSLPVAGSIRATSRVALVLLFPLGLAVGALVTACGRAGRGFAVVALGVVIADQGLLPDGWGEQRYPLAEAVERRERLADVIRRRPGAALVYVFPGRPERPPVDMPVLELQVDAMWAAQSVGLPTVNGWSGYRPTGWYAFHSYGGLFHWLTTVNGLAPDRLPGLVVLGTPTPPETESERELMARFPPVPLP